MHGCCLAVSSKRCIYGVRRVSRLGEEINYQLLFSLKRLKIRQIHARMGLKPIAVRLRQTHSFPRFAWECILDAPASSHSDLHNCSFFDHATPERRICIPTRSVGTRAFALSLTFMGFSPMRAWICRVFNLFNENGLSPCSSDQECTITANITNH